MIQKPIIKPIDIWSGDFPLDWNPIIKNWKYGQKPPYTTANYLQNQTDSALVHLYEHGIPEYDAITEYQPGSRCLRSGVLYKFTGTTAIAGTDPEILPATVWTVDEERGGVAWNSLTTYSKGDLVINPGSAPMSVYISVYNSNLNQPITDTNWWQEVGSKFYNATTGGLPSSDGLHNPSLAEYPVTTSEIIGAIWTITGLGVDANLEPIHYTMTTGPLSGQIVKDEDTFSWTSGVTGSEVWLLTKKAVVSGETGGIQYKNTTNYVIGDIVGHDNNVYIALADTVNEVPDITPLVWKPMADADTVALLDIELTDKIDLIEVELNAGGWVSGESYEVDKVVGYLGNVYVANQPGPPDPALSPDLNPTGWTQLATASTIVTVNDTLTSTSSTEALSAGMGKVLNDTKIEAGDYATSTKGGTLKVRVSSGTLYMTTNGNNP